MTNWLTGVCNANGIEIHYSRTGGARPLVLLHGLIGSGACWSPVARLLEGDYDVVMPDARGHGRSSAPLSGYRYDDHARDVIALIQELRLAAPVLLGHSMGGMTAAVVASKLGAGLSGLVLADPTFLSPERQREVHESDVLEQHRQILAADETDLLTQLKARHPRRSTELVELLAEARLRTRVEAFAVLTPPNPDYRQLMSTIDVPTLLVIGDNNPVVSLEMAQELQRLNPRLCLEQITATGHGLHYDQPDRFAAAVRSFLLARS